MTVTRLYYCDLCHRNNSDADPLRGIYFEQRSPTDKIVEKPWREVEHHICNKCLDDLREFPMAATQDNKQ